MVFNGSSSDSWLVGAHTLPKFATFKELGLVFHESGSMADALARLAYNGKAAMARLTAKFAGLMCNQVFPMLRCLFDAVVLPSVSYGCEVWVPTCVGALKPEVKRMTDIQLAFFRNLGHLRKSVAPLIIFRELAERPWEHRWCTDCSTCPPDSLHLDILTDNLADARAQPSCGDWAWRSSQVRCPGIAVPVYYRWHWRAQWP